MANCENRECRVPLHYSIDSKQNNPYFPCCSPKCYEAVKAKEKRDREEHEARWHAEKAREKEEQKQENARIQAELRRSPEYQKFKRRVEKERREEKFFAAGFNFLWFGLIAIACFVGWNIAGWLGVTIGFTIAVLVGLCCNALG